MLKNISSMTDDKDLLDIPEFLRRLSDKEKQEPKGESLPLKKEIIWPTETEEETPEEKPKKVKPKVDIQANQVNMSGTMLDKFANMLSEVLNFGSRNAGETASINTVIQGGNQSVQGGRTQVNVLTHADPMHRAILSSVAN